MTSAVPTPACGPTDPAGFTTAAAAALEHVRSRTPLVQCLTNEVTTNLVANALLAIGASPAMTSVPGEAEQLAGVAGAVLVNLGTPSPDQRASMGTTVTAARRAGVPWVLDPVAVGVLSIRTRLADELLDAGPAVVRGNASEIRALAGLGSAGRGVDARDRVDDARAAALALARLTGAAVAVSGAVDLVAAVDRVVRLTCGDALLTTITGAGCALGGLAAAFAAVASPVVAAVGSSLSLGLAAERAAEVARGPASFQIALVDELYRLRPADLARCADRVAVEALTARAGVDA